MTGSDNYEVDELQLYFGEPYRITDTIIVRQPTLGEIIEFGEDAFYNTLYIFITNPTSYRVALWDKGIDWNKLTDYNLFMMLYPNINVNALQLFLPGFYLYKVTLSNQEETIILSNDHGDIITEEIYSKISYYLRKMFNYFPKVEKAKGKITKEWIIEGEKERLKNKPNHFVSNLLPLISACLNHPGFKYKKSELKEIGIVEFMDSVKRLQVYESTTALLVGRYSGMIDTSKLNNEDFNFMREV